MFDQQTSVLAAQTEHAESVLSVSPGLARSDYPGLANPGCSKLDAPPMRGLAQPRSVVLSHSRWLPEIGKSGASASPFASKSMLKNQTPSQTVRKIGKVMQGKARVSPAKKPAFFSTPKTSQKQGNPSKNTPKNVVEMY